MKDITAKKPVLPAEPFFRGGGAGLRRPSGVGTIPAGGLFAAHSHKKIGGKRATP